MDVSWTVKKAECQRIDAFELWCWRRWRRLLRVPWTARRSNQSILKEISPGCSLEGLMLKLKLQYFGHLTRRIDSLEKTEAGSDWGKEEKGTTEDEMAGWHHRLNGRESEWTLGVGDGQGGLACCNSWSRKESDTTEWLNWSELNWILSIRHSVLYVFYIYQLIYFWTDPSQQKDLLVSLTDHWGSWVSEVSPSRLFDHGRPQIQTHGEPLLLNCYMVMPQVLYRHLWTLHYWYVMPVQAQWNFELFYKWTNQIELMFISYFAHFCYSNFPQNYCIISYRL